MWQPQNCFGSLLEVDDYSAKAHVLCANLCILAPFAFWHPLRGSLCVMTLGGAFSASCIGLLSMQRNIAQETCLIMWPRLVSRSP
jgi:hypothetical protein